jgi:large subunit ribosomal protein L21
LVQSLAVPKPDSSLSAVVVSGGKQYRVAPGDRILVDRIAAEPGASVKLGRVLLLSDGSEVKVGNPALDGVDVDAKVIAHRRGPRIESIRYKSKKRVRVHNGGRAYLTALEIIAVGGIGLPTEEKEDAAEKAKPKGRAKAAPAGRTQGASDKKKGAPKAEVVELKPEPVEEEASPKKAPRRRSKKETE